MQVLELAKPNITPIDLVHSTPSEKSDRRRACNFIRNLGKDLDIPVTCICNALALWHSFREVQSSRPTIDMLSPSIQRKKEDEYWIDQWKVDCASCVLVSVKANEVQRKVCVSHISIS